MSFEYINQYVETTYTISDNHSRLLEIDRESLNILNQFMIPNTTIHDLAIKADKLYVGTSNGLLVLDRKFNILNKLDILPGQDHIRVGTVYGITVTDDNIFMIAEGTLFKMDFSLNIIDSIYSDYLQSNSIHSLEYSKTRSKLFIGYSNKIYDVGLDFSNLKKIDLDSSINCTSLYINKDNDNIILSDSNTITGKDKLFKYDYEYGTIENITDCVESEGNESPVFKDIYTKGTDNEEIDSIIFYDHVINKFFTGVVETEDDSMYAYIM